MNVKLEATIDEDGHAVCLLSCDDADRGVQGGEARPAWGVGREPHKAHTRKAPFRVLRETGTSTFEWARGELNPHVLSDTRT